MSNADLNYLITRLLQTLIVENEQSQVLLDQTTSNQLSILLPNTFPLACYLLDTRSLHIALFSPSKSIDAAEEMLLFVRASKNSKSGDVEIVDLHAFNCQCRQCQSQMFAASEGSALGSALGSGAAPISRPITSFCPHLLTAYIWSLHRDRLSSYIEIEVLETVEEWCDMVENITMMSI